MRTLLPLLLLALPLTAAAQAYRWVDEQGKAHFTQTPPAAGSYQTLPAPPRPGLGGTPDLGGVARKLQHDREQREQRQQQAQDLATRRQASCSAARGRRAFLKNYEGRIASTAQDGSSEQWTPQQHAAESARVESTINENCT